MLRWQKRGLTDVLMGQKIIPPSHTWCVGYNKINKSMLHRIGYRDLFLIALSVTTYMAVVRERKIMNVKELISALDKTPKKTCKVILSLQWQHTDFVYMCAYVCARGRKWTYKAKPVTHEKCWIHVLIKIVYIQNFLNK